MRKKGSKNTEKLTVSKVDKLWGEVIKARAGYRSELSGAAGRQIGGDAILHPHHLRGKSTYRLRYELENGVCCTSGEHKFGFHHAGRREGYEQKIAAKRRPDLFEYLEKLKWEVCKTSLHSVKIFLENELSKY